ncbi:MAG TPA: hypothetical protein VMT58_08430 [Candidatus Binataceae bacterium]|nr:hypothetical protein [Candidatus Binataceae bacterium]
MSPPSKLELERFVSTYLYSSEAFLIDEVTRIDPATREIEARMDTTRPLPVARYQVGDPGTHPRHVSGPDLVLITGNLGCLHAYFIHGCRWEDGWVGFGNRIHRADFRSLVTVGPPLRLHSKETKTRTGSKRVVMRYEFRFWQEEKLVYFGDQSAIFVKGRAFEDE